MPNQGKLINCIVCNKLFRRGSKKIKACSHECAGELRKGENNGNWKGGITLPKDCIICGKPTNRGYTIYCSLECMGKSHKIRYETEGHPCTKDAPPSKYGKRWKKFRDLIVTRDGKCLLCNSKTDLSVHHIKSWKEFPELRLEPSNVITLCKTCHAVIHWSPKEKMYNEYFKKMVSKMEGLFAES